MANSQADTDCKHYNAEWIYTWGGHFWRCKAPKCRAAVMPLSPSHRQKIAVFYAPVWDKLAPEWEAFRKNELGIN